MQRTMGRPMIGKLGWGVMTSLALIIAVYAIALLFVPAMRALFLQERFAAVPLAAYLHLAGSGIALAIGPFQLNPRLRNRFLQVHRWMGRTYVISVLLGGVAASRSRPCRKRDCRRTWGLGCLRYSGCLRRGMRTATSAQATGSCIAAG